MKNKTHWKPTNRKTWKRLLIAAISTAGVAMAAPAGVAAASSLTSSAGAAVVTSLDTTTYGPVLVVGGTGPLAGAPLYAITSDTNGSFGCTTKLETTFQGPITCTGPESDILNGVTSDEWPAFTTIGRPVAGPGVNPRLLAEVNRGKAIGWQVTYGGRPLYLFDPPSSPFAPAGENFLETVKPLPPWHGLWDLVSARSGASVAGPATIETETLSSGVVLAAETYQNAVPGGVAVTVYAYTGPNDQSFCADCYPTWIPLLSTGTPAVSGGANSGGVGLKNIGHGRQQVTYNGKPLYIYSGEKAVFNDGQPATTGTQGNGNGLAGPYGGTFATLAP